MRTTRKAALFVMLSLTACATAQPEPPAAAPSRHEPPAVEQAAPSTSPPVVAIPNARSPEPGIVTGGVPSEANLRQAQALGYRTVISLLPEADGRAEAALTRVLGMDFVSIPIAGEADLTEANARKLGEVLASPASRPLILHCASGNRSGALLALHAFYVQGKTAEEALALGKAAGLTSLHASVQAKLTGAPPTGATSPQGLP